MSEGDISDQSTMAIVARHDRLNWGAPPSYQPRVWTGWRDRGTCPIRCATIYAPSQLLRCDGSVLG